MPNNKSKNVTLKDIANITGYTANTVSRVINNKDNIADETRNLILSKAKEMGYVGNALASSLRSGISGTVAVIISDVSNPLFGIMIKEIDNMLFRKNYCAFVLNTGEKYEAEEKAIVLSISKKVDGVILCPTQESREAIKLLQTNRVPFVLMGRRFTNEDDDYVVWDDFKGGYLATSHLIKQGHKRILYLNGPKYISSASDRLSGYRKALEENNLPFQQKLVRQINIASTDIHRTLLDTLDAGVEFTAIFAFSDLIAFEAVSALESMGYCIPSDVAVVGFDNIQSKLSLPFPLTSVSTPKTKMAHKVVEILLNRIRDGEDDKKRQIILNTTLMVRGSS